MLVPSGYYSIDGEGCVCMPVLLCQQLHEVNTGRMDKAPSAMQATFCIRHKSCTLVQTGKKQLHQITAVRNPRSSSDAKVMFFE